MNGRIALCAVLAAGLQGCGAGVPGSGVSRTETRSLPPFDHVTFLGAGRAFIAVGGPQSFEITGDDNLLPLIETRIDGGTLVIRPVERIRPVVEPVLRIGIPDLRGVTLIGATTADVRGVDHETFAVSLSGACAATAAGRAGHLTASIAGDGTVEATGLRARTTAVKITGSGVVAVQSSDELDVTIMGAGTVRYSGAPKVTRNVTGSGTIEPIR